MKDFMFPLGASFGFFVFSICILIIGPEERAESRVCKQWAGKSAIVYEGKCMVPTEGGGLRPARRDE